MTAGREGEAVLRVLRGEPLEVVARELAVTAADLSGGRDAFLEAGAASPKSRPREDRDETVGRLRAEMGELTMDDELLQTKMERLESGVPLAGRTPARRAPSSRSPRAADTAWPAFAGCGASRERRVHRLRRAAEASAPRRRPGPQGAMDDAGLVAAAQWVPADSPFHGPRAIARSGRGLGTPACAPSKERVRRARRDIRPLDGGPILLAARARPVGGEPGGPAPRPARPRRRDHPRGHRRDGG